MPNAPNAVMQQLREKNIQTSFDKDSECSVMTPAVPAVEPATTEKQKIGEIK